MITSEDVNAVIIEALSRHRGGSKKYGDLDLVMDGRDFYQEAVEELLDCINYQVYQVLRLRALQDGPETGRKDKKTVF